MVAQFSTKEINIGTVKHMIETMNIAAVLRALVGIAKATKNHGTNIPRYLATNFIGFSLYMTG